MQWSDRDIAVLDRAEVGIGLSPPTNLATSDPIDMASPRVFHRRDGSGICASAEPRELHAFHVVGGNGREVDVEQGVRRKVGQRYEVLEEWREDLHLLAELRYV